MEKDYIVSKSNHFIINSSYDLSLEEQRIILILASMVQPKDKEFEEYTFKISEFIKKIGIKDQKKYSSLPLITKELMKKVFEIRTEGEILQMSWLSIAKHNLGNGTVTLGFSPYLKPYLLELKDHYTNYKLSNILQMKSKYSPRLYELLKMNQFNKKGFEIEVSELRKLFKAENIYERYNDFKKRILEKSQVELEKYSDIKFQFEEIKLARTVVSIRFFVFENIKKTEPAKVKAKTLEKTASEKKADKIIKEKIADEQRIKDVNQQNEEYYEFYLSSSDVEKAEIEEKAEQLFLKESNQTRFGKINRTIYEKAKKSLITRVISEMQD